MPVISRFFGIAIRIYFRDHAPAHFHARYAEHEASISIESLEVIEGRLPPRAQRMVIEWAVLNRQALRDDWRLALAGQPLQPIAPLE